MMAFRRVALSTIVLAWLFAPNALAQRGQDAGLVGVVRDTSGAILAGGRVTVSSAQLFGGSMTTITDSEGGYRFPFLPPGDYQIVAEHDGLKPKRAVVALVPGLTFTVDLVLDVPGVVEAVRVEGLPPAVDVRSSATPALIDRALIQNLPLPRSIADALNVAPGVGRDIAFGGSQNANPLSLDGTTGNEPSWGTPIVAPNLNWIEELQIVSAGADAQYGEFTGARENAITRSGSNTFSGLADVWTTQPNWTANNRGTLTPQLQERFRPLEIFHRWDSDVQVGGPAVADRLWFFAGGEVYRNAYRPGGFSGVVKAPGEPKDDSHESKYILKLTGALAPAIHADGYFVRDTRYETGANARPSTRPETLVDLESTERIWNARLQWTLSPRAFLEVRHGGHHFNRFAGPPEERRAGPPAHEDQVTGITSQNAETFSQFESQPIGTSAHLTYFAPGARGRSHEIRGGYEFEHARLLQSQGFVGGMLFMDVDGRPDTVQIGGDVTYRPTYNRHTVYVQDGWRATDRVTLNVGLRAGVYNGAVPDRGRVFGAHSISPRVGAAWDVAADHRTVVRAHYGRYHDEMVTTFFDFLDPLSQTPTIVAAVLGPGQYQEVTRFVSTENASLDPDLRLSFAEEYLVGIEHELPWGISAQAQYIQRDFKDTVGFIDTGSIWQPAERTDPGPDGRLGTADDGGPFTVFVNVDPTRARLLQTNPSGAYRQYRGVEFAGTRRSRGNFGLQASYVWSRTLANFNNGFSSNAGSADTGTNGVFANPNKAINFDGRTSHDYTHNLKALWTYRLPAWGGLNVSGVYQYLSGRPWARNVGGLGPQVATAVYVEPRGTRQMRAIHTADVRLEKTFKPSGRAGTVGVFADVFNVWNQGVETTINNTSGPNLGVPNSWLDPRSLRAGVRLIF